MADNEKKKEMDKKVKTEKRRTSFIKRGFLKDRDDIVEEVSTVPSKKVVQEEISSSVFKFKNVPQARWALNVINNKNVKKLSGEFIENKRVKPQNYTTDVYSKNDAKNRYNDIICMDSTRVVLKNRKPGDDYIHASWMTMQDGQKYICTQGPLPETIEDFWHMVYTEKSSVIVMLCNLVEGKHEKCARYYPKTKDSSEVYGSYKVRIKEIRPDPFEGIHYQILECKHNGNSFVVHHLINPNWPDHIAPEKPTTTVGMFKLAKKLASKKPITVHCSAGIGRTATFVGIDYASQKIHTDENASMIDVLKDLRVQRFHSIQSPLQYIFLHMCLLELFVEEGSIPRKGKFQAYMDQYENMLKRYAAKMARKEKEAAALLAAPVHSTHTGPILN